MENTLETTPQKPLVEPFREPPKESFDSPVVNSIIIGRGFDCDLVCEDISVSRTHAALSLRKDGAYVLEDKSSSNGTFVDGVKIEKAVIDEESHVMLGEYETLGKNLITELEKRKKIGISYLLALIFQDSFTKNRKAIIATILIILAIVIFSLINFSSSRIDPPPNLTPIKKMPDRRSLEKYNPRYLSLAETGLGLTLEIAEVKNALYKASANFKKSRKPQILKTVASGGERRLYV
jgi:pSer/pThr/pTyr-binding forkhead associated (FHA) protein